MRSVNKVILIGNLTRDPELRQTPNGQNIVGFGIATNRAWVTSTGEKKASAEFHECIAWAKLAEICSKYLKKGKLVYLEGYLKTRSWESEEGIKKFKTEIVVEDMIMLDRRTADTEGVKASDAEGVATVASDSQAEPEESAEPEGEYVPTETNAIDKDLGL